MKLFRCQSCGQLVYFENIRCEHCGHALGYLPGLATISALEPDGEEAVTALADGHPYRPCDNARAGVCNWLINAGDENSFCLACRHNRVVPDLSQQGNAALWARLEAAKHRLFYTLLRLRLPLESRAEDPQRGLVFEFLQDSTPHQASVLTGHADGLITLAVREADDAVRERTRGEMHEPYRTLLGHFRHESGHYFWDRLVARDPAMLAKFRDLFGDEREDYAAALQKHYAESGHTNWQDEFVSLYASSHPWEDFAETWAHYLHIVDTLETAAAFGLKVRPKLAGPEMAAEIHFNPHNAPDIATLIDTWLPVAFAVNSMNRSMGQPDLYPFVLSPAAIGKLGFIHALTHAPAPQMSNKPVMATA